MWEMDRLLVFRITAEEETRFFTAKKETYSTTETTR
jgi:hypothetical protein